ncbi:TRAP transporter substrate-binding protein [Thermodesulfobacteriota bacterium]
MNTMIGQKRTGTLIFLLLFIIPFFVFGNMSPVKAADKPIKLKFAYWMSTKHSLHSVFEKYAKEVKELTNGRVQITLYPGGALGGPRQQWDMAVGGITDISFFMPGYTAGRFPLTTVFDLPLLLGYSSTVNTAIAQGVFEEYIEREYKDAKMLFFFVSEPFTFHTSKKKINSMADIKGLKFRSSGAVQSAMVKALGGSPVTLPITEVYTSLEKGVIDGVVTAFTAMVGYRLFDVVKYSINAGITATPMAVAMNKKTWNSLPPDVKKILDNMRMRYAFECSTKYDGDVKKALALGKSKGKVIYPLPAAELARWEQKLAPVYGQWEKDMKKKGLPGSEVLGKIRQLQSK